MMNKDSQQHIMPTKLFLNKFARNLIIGFGIIFLSLLLGMLGYHYIEKMPWVDAYLNAAMILSGMGPVHPLQSEEGKIFAGTYALFSGIVFLVVIAIVFGPVVKRFMHSFHIEEMK